MNRISRPLLATFAIVLVITALAMGLAVTHEMGGMDGSLHFFDHDLSHSAFGWAIAIPVLLLVGLVVAAVCAGVALLTITALTVAGVLVVAALLLAMAPLAIFMAMPVLALYGFVKLLQRNPTQAA